MFRDSVPQVPLGLPYIPSFAAQTGKFVYYIRGEVTRYCILEPKERPNSQSVGKNKEEFGVRVIMF